MPDLSLFPDSVAKLASDWWGGLLDILFPVQCLVCQDQLRDNKRICASCLTQLPRTDYLNLRENKLYERIGRMNGLHHASGWLWFAQGSSVQELIHVFKYGKDQLVGWQLGTHLANAIQEAAIAGEYDVVIPVPLHKKKLKKRGFNQSAILASAIAKHTEMHLEEEGLLRVKNTEVQARKSADERQTNVKQAFKVNQNSRLEGKRVLLVDDVITTGNTILEAAKCLQDAEVRHVGVVSLALAKQ